MTTDWARSVAPSGGLVTSEVGTWKPSFWRAGATTVRATPVMPLALNTATVYWLGSGSEGTSAGTSVLLTGSGGFGAVPVVDAVLTVGSWAVAPEFPSPRTNRYQTPAMASTITEHGDDDRGHHPQLSLEARRARAELLAGLELGDALEGRGGGRVALAGEPFLEPPDRAALPDRHDDQAHRGEERRGWRLTGSRSRARPSARHRSRWLGRPRGPGVAPAPPL